MQIPSMPFNILALAPFRPGEETPWRQGTIRVDKTNLDQVLAETGLSLYIPLPNNLCQKGGLTISFKRLKDFHPDSIIKK